MSKAYNLSSLASRNNLGNAGDVFTSTGPDTIPNLSPLSARVTQLNGIQQIPNRIGVNKSTGVVTISAQPSLSELDVPGWDKGQNISQWSTLQYYLSATAFSNRKIPVSAVYVEYLPAVPAYHRGTCLAPNGKIYTIPHGAGPQTTYGLIIDPSSNTISSYIATIGGLGDTNFDPYFGSVLGSNGKIYFVPDRATVGAFVDPSNNIVSTFGTLPAFPIATNAFSGAISAPNGKIYLIPENSTIGRTIDPNTNTFGTYPSSSWSGGLSYNSTAALAPNGKIYVFPYGSTLVAKIDPSNDSTTVILSNVTNIIGSVLAPNGYIYLFPTTSAQKILRFDPASETVSTIATINPTGGTACLLPNGKILYGGLSNTIVAILDPSNETIQTICTISGSANYFGWSLAPNGKAYSLPFSNSNIICLNFLNNNNFNINVCTNPFFNKN